MPRPTDRGLHHDEEERMGLLQEEASNRLRNGNRRLEETRRAAAESEEIGMNVITELQGQREGIMRTKAHYDDIDDQLGISKQILRSIGVKISTDRFLLFVVAFLLTLANVVVVYYKIQKVLSYIPLVR
mmetsp:Transcript_20489/g.30524  ORF Transcript_20489/g.30524 Transcript_20489/m.30524 type:complete len:129 (+) Transcript_20489:95-481(+)